MHYMICLCAPVKQLNNTLLWDSLTDTLSRSWDWLGLKIACFVFPVLFLTWINFPAHTAAQVQFRGWCGDQGHTWPEAASTAQPQGCVGQLKNTDTRRGSQRGHHALPRLPLIIILSLWSEVGLCDSCPVLGASHTGAGVGFAGAACGTLPGVVCAIAVDRGVGLVGFTGRRSGTCSSEAGLLVASFLKLQDIRAKGMMMSF